MPDMFEISAAAYVEDLKKKAIAEVNVLSSQDLADPGLAGRLDRIAENHMPQFLVLGKPLEGIPNSKTIDRDDYGFYDARVITYLDVVIPFRGDENLLRVSPSYVSLPGSSFRVKGQTFVVTVLDDEQTGRRIEDFCNSMRQNFDSMRQDLERSLPQLCSAITEAAKRRANILKADAERHSKLPFPVRSRGA